MNRTSVPIDPAHNMKATEDFLRVVLFAHIVAASKTVLSSDKLSITTIAEKVVDEFVSFDMYDDTSDSDISDQSSDENNEESDNDDYGI